MQLWITVALSCIIACLCWDVIGTPKVRRVPNVDWTTGSTLISFLAFALQRAPGHDPFVGVPPSF